MFLGLMEVHAVITVFGKGENEQNLRHEETVHNMIYFRIVRAFLIEEQKIIQRVLKSKETGKK